jgi:hypothetical protein
MTSRIYRQESKNPEPSEQNLVQDASTGSNSSLERADVSARSAFDIKWMHGWLSEFSSEELRQIRVINPGTRLEMDATYLQLAEAERREFTADGTENVIEVNYYIPKKDIPDELWNRLIHKQVPADPR